MQRLADLMSQFDKIKRSITDNVDNYKQFISRIEIIKSINSKLSNDNKVSITSTEEVLKNLSAFITNLNILLVDKSKDIQFDSDITIITSKEFEIIEESFYKDIQDNKSKLGDLSDKLDGLSINLNQTALKTLQDLAKH